MLFRAAFKIVNSYILYIPILALSGMFGKDLTRGCLLLSELSGLILCPIIFGSIVETAAKSEKSSIVDLFFDHFAKYLGFVLIMAAPLMVSGLIMPDMQPLNKYAYQSLAGILVQSVSLYMLPLVFLKRRVFISISEGFKIFIRHLIGSLPLIVLIVLTMLIELIGTIVLYSISESPDILLIYGVGYLQNIVNWYIGLIIFTTATLFVLEGSSILRINGSSAAC